MTSGCIKSSQKNSSVLKEKKLKYSEFAGKSYDSLFREEQREGAEEYQVNEFRSAVFLNQGKATYTMYPLPLECQVLPVLAIVADDFDGDGILDLLLDGNLYGVKHGLGRFDDNHGVVAKGDGIGKFHGVPMIEMGIYLKSEVRDLQRVQIGATSAILVGFNNGPVRMLKPNRLAKS